MTRVTPNVATRKKHKKIVKAAKGYKLGRKNRFKLAKQAVIRASQNAYKDRRLKKRTFRQLWVTRISAAAKQNGMNYSTLMSGLRNAKVLLDRKMLAELAVSDKKVFEKVMVMAG